MPLARHALDVSVWGAGRDGKRFARSLEALGLKTQRFVDIDPKKVGSVRRGVPIVSHGALDPKRDVVLAAVGSVGARRVIRPQLDALGFIEGTTCFWVA